MTFNQAKKQFEDLVEMFVNTAKLDKSFIVMVDEVRYKVLTSNGAYALVEKDGVYDICSDNKNIPLNR